MSIEEQRDKMKTILWTLRQIREKETDRTAEQKMSENAEDKEAIPEEKQLETAEITDNDLSMTVITLSHCSARSVRRRDTTVFSTAPGSLNLSREEQM